MNARQILTSVRGFTVGEMAAALSVAGLLAGAAAPALQDYIDEARHARARQDVRAIASAMSRLEGDVLGQSAKPNGWATYELLVGAGEAPKAGGTGDGAWLAIPGTANVGLLDDQLVTNTAGYASRPARQVEWIRGWHGPYLEAGVGPDPWGHRYAINVQALAGGGSSTVVLSAGPNGLVETAFRSPVIVPGGDDLIALVATGR
ncbi:MAG: hypothetical protein AB1806_03845 [Acidobacteriota bacterium]